MSFSRRLESAEPDDARDLEQADLAEQVGAQRSVTRSAVGWRYGSALAAARALNARPARV
jgi:hypothetical protein